MTENTNKTPLNKAIILDVAVNSSPKEELLNTIVDCASKSVIAKPSSVLQNEVVSKEQMSSRSANWRSGDPEGITKAQRDCFAPICIGARNDNSMIVFTPNPEFLVEAQKDKEFRDLLNKADVNLPDGVGLVWAGRILGSPVKERVSGADIVERLLEIGNGGREGREGKVGREEKEGVKKKQKGLGWTVGIAGIRRGVESEADELIKRLGERYPRVKFVNLDDPNFKFEILNFKSISNDQILNVKNMPKFTDFNMVLAAHGMKKQEEWIWENKDKIKANVFMGVGGSLDFLTGFTRRAPAIWRKLGMEWLWRSIQRPSHLKRAWKATVVFLWLVMKKGKKGDF